MDRVPANQTVSFLTYKEAVIRKMASEGCAPSHEFFQANAAHLHRAFDNGEPIWMAADELRFRFQVPAVRRTKTPRELATRIVSVA